MSTQAGQLTIDIAAGVARLKADMAEAKGVVNKTMREIDGAVGFAKKALGALGLVIGARALINLAEQTMTAVDATAKLADRLGIATESVTAYAYAAKLAGVSQETFAKALRTIQIQGAQAAQGLGQSAKAFEVLGINARDFVNLAPEKQLELLIERMGGVRNVTERTAIAAQLFGARATEMLNLVNEGADALRTAREDTEAFGTALSRVDAAKVEAANDSMTRAQEAARGVLNTIVVQLSPYIKALADSFSDSAKAANGWKDQTINAIEAVAMGVAYAADGVHFLKLGFKTLTVGTAEAINALIQAFTWLDEALTDINNAFANTWIGKKLGAEVKSYNDAVQEIAEVSRNRVAELEDELIALASQPLPHTGVQQFFDDIKRKAQEAAEAVAATRATQNGGGEFTSEDAGDKKSQKEYDKYLADIADRVSVMREGFMTEREQEALHYEEKQFMLLEALQAGAITREEYNRYEEELELRHQAAMGDISAQGALQRRDFEKKTALEKTQFILGTLGQLTQGAATHNKAMFQINKMAGIANAIINTALGVTQALKTYPPPLSIAMAAIQFAAGMAQVQQIKSAQFGSASSAPSVGGGGAVPTTPADSATATAPAAPASTAPQRIVNISIQSESGLISEEYLRTKIMPMLNDAVGDGVQLNATAG
jgi:hypothetical protein